MNPTIRFKAPADDSFGPARELLCSVWPLVQEGEQVMIGDPIFVNEMVLVRPHRRSDETSMLELPKAGPYLIELRYPNGATSRATIAVTKGEQYRFVVQGQRQAPLSVMDAAPSSSLVPRVIAAALKTMHLKEPDLEVKTVKQSRDVSLKSLREFAADLNDSSINQNVLERVFNADHAYTMQVPSGVAVNFRDGYRRQWLVVSGAGKSQTMIVYPFGWADRSGEGFRLSMHRSAKIGTDASKWSVTFKLMDPIYGSLVEHLTRRDIQSSSTISESMRGQATTALYEKEGNPFAAAAAAYLFALGDGDLDYRREWMANLSNRYDWLPDGAIALGWKLLRDGSRGSTAWNESRELLFLAFSRGLPYYTVGLHILVEALTVLSLANPEDMQVRAMLAAARAADVACVRTEPFITLQIPRFLGLPVQ